MNDAIKTLEALNVRWPGFFDLVRAQNGYESSIRYEDLMRINNKMIADEPGMELLVQAMMRLMKEDQVDPSVAEWFEKTGFISRRVVDLRALMREATMKLNSLNLSDKERESLTERLIQAKQEADKVRSQGAQDMSRGFAGLRGLVGDHQ
jgi:hypothetical protein